MATTRGAGSPVRIGLTALGVVLAWSVIALASTAFLFVNSERTVTLAGHEARIRPALDSEVVLATGPILPDLRVSSGTVIGADITLGKTEADSLQELTARYGALAAAPDGQEAKIRATVVQMLGESAVRGAAAGGVVIVVFVGGWWLMGPARRREIVEQWRTRWRTRRGLAATPLVAGGAVLLVLGLVQPWAPREERLPVGEWQSLEEFLGPDLDIRLPEELAGVQVRGDVTTARTRRLVSSAVGSFEASNEFYADVVDTVPELELREPAEDEDESVVVLVSDRHDNVGMDQVVGAVADHAEADGIYDAGDDTSTGASWEDFSLDSLDTATEEYEDRWAVSGNHDHGDFTAEYLAERGWTMLTGEVVTGPGGGTLLGIPDPRSSGLGAWRDTTGTTFSEAEHNVAEIACESQEEGERINTVLVHDANLGRETLQRGCADLVLGGHVHVASGPTAVTGENGETGYSYTTGTTGGAAYAIAVGKPRRTAQITLITYRDGTPYGLQPVMLETNGNLFAGDFVPLDGLED